MAVQIAVTNRTLTLLAMSGLLLAAWLPVAPAAHAQESDEAFATVTVSADLLSNTIGSREETWGEVFEYFEVYADGRLCGVLPLLNEDGSNLGTDPVFEVGLRDQPEVCSVDRARLSYIDSSGRILFQKHHLAAGGEYTIDNFAPEPPVNPSPFPQVLIPARVLDTPEADAIGHLQVVAAGAVCGEIVLTDPSIRNEDGDIVFYTHPYEGRICGDPREDELRFADPQGRLLSERFAFDFSRPMVLFDFALDDSGQTLPLPPSVGTGLEASTDRGGFLSVPALLIGIGLAAVGWSLMRLRRGAR